MPASPPPDLRPYFQTYTDLPGPLEWCTFWGNSNPVEIEVGCGKGMFLVNSAEENRDINYLGLEIDFKIARYAAKRFQRRGLSNARIIGGDALAGMPKYFPSQSLSALHVYFPDPWWKRRHRERRVFNDALIQEATRLLLPGSLLHAWTDVEEYFQVMLETVSKEPRFAPLPTPAERPAEHDLDYHTNFERKKRQEGLPIFRACWQFRS